ncbi:hypothetical protein GBA52_027123 [Prunus armeniaca]|nr:hypothetical protein GBA52_027123 [Prunus armeniaca]
MLCHASRIGGVIGKSGLENVNVGGGGGEEEIEVSKAQEALLRVFERILEVAAETGAIPADVGVVSCRFLAERQRRSGR